MELALVTNMKKLIVLFLFSLLTAFAQTTSVSLTTSVKTTALQDFENYRLTLRAGVSNEGTLTASITSTATSMAISGVCPENGVEVIIDSEPILVTAGSGTSTCTITRNSALAVAGTSAAAHNSSVQVFELAYANATALLKFVIGSFLANTAIPALGANSATIGSGVATISTTQASNAAALTPSTLAQ